MKTAKFLFLFVFSAITFGCGEKKENNEKEGFQVKRTKESVKEEVDENVIALSSNDLMQYDKNELRVKAGKKVTLTLRHTGKLEKLVMGHNFVLLKTGTDIGGFATDAAASRENDYIPEGTESVIVHTKMLGGGESTTITFDAPAVGTYDFICSFPGHYSVMQGKFIVEGS
ncbi:MAG: azurin [Bacteroidota bacterium]